LTHRPKQKEFILVNLIIVIIFKLLNVHIKA
jgi:hypothetical protein